MAIVLNGMTDREMTTLTLDMASSGDMNDLSFLGETAVDKHSTGGVGDKITPIIMPLCATFGVKSVKLSGRGLGFTGGTVDKFASIKDFNINVPSEDFPSYVNKSGMVISGQTPSLAPADKKLYALRDVTGTVDSVPLIASSIMSKKLAGGADAIVLDVTCGSGAFMKTESDARRLAEAMIKIGTLSGRKTVAVITDMDQPLGRTCGNVIEMQEVFESLSGTPADDVIEVASTIGAYMVKLSGKVNFASDEELIEECRERIKDGRVLTEYIKLIRSQGGQVDGNGRIIYEDLPEVVGEVKAESCGYVTSLKADDIGHASVKLGAGRMKVDDVIDYGAGIRFLSKKGDYVSVGDTLAILYKGSKSTPDRQVIDEVSKMIRDAYKLSESKPQINPGIIDVLGV